MCKNLNAIIVRSKWTKAFDFPLSFTILFSTNISIIIQQRVDTNATKRNHRLLFMLIFRKFPNMCNCFFSFCVT